MADDDSPSMKNVYMDAKGRMYCKAHRREVCQVCCVDHRFCNELATAGGEVDMDALNAKHDALHDAEHAAMVAQHVVEGGTGPVTLGMSEAQWLYDGAASRPGQHACAHCGSRGDKLLICSRCKAAWYCGKDCQSGDWKTHKKGCKTAAVKAKRPELIGWAELEELGGALAPGRVLEVKIMAQPMAFARFSFPGKDHLGEVRHCCVYADNPPTGLTLGRILRWHNPHYHWFLDGSSGARIDDQDVADVTTAAQ